MSLIQGRTRAGQLPLPRYDLVDPEKVSLPPAPEGAYRHTLDWFAHAGEASISGYVKLREGEHPLTHQARLNISAGQGLHVDLTRYVPEEGVADDVPFTGTVTPAPPLQLLQDAAEGLTNGTAEVRKIRFFRDKVVLETRVDRHDIDIILTKRFTDNKTEFDFDHKVRNKSSIVKSIAQAIFDPRAHFTLGFKLGHLALSWLSGGFDKGGELDGKALAANLLGDSVQLHVKRQRDYDWPLVVHSQDAALQLPAGRYLTTLNVSLDGGQPDAEGHRAYHVEVDGFVETPVGTVELCAKHEANSVGLNSELDVVGMCVERAEAALPLTSAAARVGASGLRLFGRGSNDSGYVSPVNFGVRAGTQGVLKLIADVHQFAAPDSSDLLTESTKDVHYENIAWRVDGIDVQSSEEGSTTTLLMDAAEGVASGTAQTETYADGATASLAETQVQALSVQGLAAAVQSPASTLHVTAGGLDLTSAQPVAVTCSTNTQTQESTLRAHAADIVTTAVTMTLVASDKPTALSVPGAVRVRLDGLQEAAATGKSLGGHTPGAPLELTVFNEAAGTYEGGGHRLPLVVGTPGMQSVLQLVRTAAPGAQTRVRAVTFPARVVEGVLNLAAGEVTLHQLAGTLDGEVELDEEHTPVQGALALQGASVSTSGARLGKGVGKSSCAEWSASGRFDALESWGDEPQRDVRASALSGAVVNVASTHDGRDVGGEKISFSNGAFRGTWQKHMAGTTLQQAHGTATVRLSGGSMQSAGAAGGPALQIEGADVAGTVSGAWQQTQAEDSPNHLLYTATHLDVRALATGLPSGIAEAHSEATLRWQVREQGDERLAARFSLAAGSDGNPQVSGMGVDFLLGFEAVQGRASLVVPTPNGRFTARKLSGETQGRFVSVSGDLGDGWSLEDIDARVSTVEAIHALAPGRYFNEVDIERSQNIEVSNARNVHALEITHGRLEKPREGKIRVDADLEYNLKAQLPVGGRLQYAWERVFQRGFLAHTGLYLTAGFGRLGRLRWNFERGKQTADFPVQVGYNTRANVNVAFDFVRRAGVWAFHRFS